MFALCTDKLRMSEIARKIDITATEASRQIHRLHEESLIQKEPDGAYILNNYGKLVLHFFSSYSFIFQYKQYFLNHDIWRIPPQFISRLGELSHGTFCEEIAEIVDGIESMMQCSEDNVCVITDQVMHVHRIVMDERISKGVKFRALIHKKLINPSEIQVTDKNEERRVLSIIPCLLSITEKQALVSFLSMDGKISNSGFFGNDASFMRWANDFFVYYWDLANRR